MYLSLPAQVFVLSAVAVTQGLPFFVEEDPFVPQDSGTSAQEVAQIY